MTRETEARHDKKLREKILLSAAMKLLRSRVNPANCARTPAQCRKAQRAATAKRRETAEAAK